MEKEQLDRIARIIYMENIYDEIYALVVSGQRSKLHTLKDKIHELESYYESEAWMSDFEADQNGEIPKDLKRGILAEDTIYDLLCEINEADDF